MNFEIDRNSFFIGLLAGWVSLWMWRLLGPTIRDLRRALRSQVSAVQTGLSSSIENRYRQDIVDLAQESHIAAPLFSLDEIAMPLRLLAPPPRVVPDEELPPDDTFSLTIPYMPDWPEMAAIYHAPTLSIEEVLRAGINLVLLGRAGSGKSFALNMLASKFARRDSDLGELSGLVPVLVHAGDLELPVKKGKLLEVLYNALYDKVSAIVEAQLTSFLQGIFEGSRVILMIDGLDEFPADAQALYFEFLEEILEKYPETRIVIAGSMEHIPHSEHLDLFPIALAAWDSGRSRDFIIKWGELWEKFIPKENWSANIPPPLEAAYVNGWLYKDQNRSNPLHLTMKIWSVYAGDLIGPSAGDALEAYVRRMTSEVENSRQALEQLAAQIAISSAPLIERKQAGKFVAQFEDPTAPSDRKESEMLEHDTGDEEVELIDEDLEELDDFDIPDAEEIPVEQEKAVSARGVRRMLPEMVKNHLLIYRAKALISFAHPIVGSYLAGCGLAKFGGEQELVRQPEWEGRTLALQFLAARTNVAQLIPNIAGESGTDRMCRGLLHTGKWLGTAPRNSPWRGAVMQALAKALNDGSLSMGLRGRVLTALAISGEGGVNMLFRQLLSSPSPELQMLGALGAGMVQDEKAVTDLNELLYNPIPNVRRAACLGLGAIGTTESIEMVATALLQGEEDVRRAAAEVLSFNVEEGYPILKEGSEIDDLIVRRAVTFGLAWVEEPWARTLLEKLQIEDDQWMVRTTAGQVIEALDKPNPFIPSAHPKLEDTPWLITFASEKGMGLAPGKASFDMLKLALTEGVEDQKLAAMDYYAHNPEAAGSVVRELLGLVEGNDSEMKEAAYRTLWHMQGMGIDVTARS